LWPTAANGGVVLSRLLMVAIIAGVSHQSSVVSRQSSVVSRQSTKFGTTDHVAYRFAAQAAGDRAPTLMCNSFKW
jgi:hypothetical protein